MTCDEQKSVTVSEYRLCAADTATTLLGAVVVELW